MIPTSVVMLDASILSLKFGNFFNICLRSSQVLAKIQENEDVIQPNPASSKKVLAIDCKRKEFNHYKGQRYDKFKPIPLASKGWFHKKSKGDFFTINNNLEGRLNEDAQNTSFTETNLDMPIVNFLAKQGLNNPTEIQLRGIPSILRGRNTILAAETGCGKTLAYLLPLVQLIMSWKKNLSETPFNCPLAIILSPNRELAQQIHEVAKELGDEFNINTKVIVGGHTKRMMVNPNFNNVDILVGTVGAISKLVSSGIYNISLVRHVVLDEADTLLDDSFEEKVTPFLNRFKFSFKSDHSTNMYPAGVQLTLASATMPRGASERLSQFLPDESLFTIKTKNLHHILGNVKQHFLRLGLAHRPAELLNTVKKKNRGPIMIFCTKTPTSQWLSMFLNENGVDCINLNGEMPVEVRAGKLDSFLNGSVDVISCTDIGSRGLNTVQVEHVLNYEFPLHIADYIHRCGRTGRLGSKGCGLVTNFISGPREIDLVQKIELATRTGAELPNVNGNIKRLIIHRINKKTT
ncbi:probable ATP-dependent RNA helicase DDX28 [Ischnura elegans]|uniref:probable ATP-dependent RNA helicase DDX28 n=1 Tax=Ischnura elegans TaxID=197161 RepID=UPI001ED89E7F|nr:probable ATP-dependent RNA helicase DDX28 [Ischnura elegans]